MERFTLDMIERLTAQLNTQEQRELIEHLSSRLGRGAGRPAPADLYGAWRGQFPEGFDVDAALNELRAGWERSDQA